MNYQNDNCADASANGSAQLRFTVPPDCDKMPAKHFLKGRCGLSTRMITQLKREKNGILMNGKILRTVDRVEAGAEVVVSVASDYGVEEQGSAEGVTVECGPKEEAEIRAMIADADAVIDATHPYAVIVTDNIRKAAEAEGVER